MQSNKTILNRWQHLNLQMATWAEYTLATLPILLLLIFCGNFVNSKERILLKYYNLVIKMCDELKLYKQGAEARLYECVYLGKPTIIKERFQKKYRHPDLDTTITKERIKNEARSIVRCKAAGVRTPTLYLVDFDRRRIYMEHFTNSITVKDLLIYYKKANIDESAPNTVAKKIGETVRKIHDNNIIHGDLTTSNMLLIENSPSEAADHSKWLKYGNLNIILIDFGLSFIDSSTEDKGVDLYVLERAVISTHNDYPDLFDKILDSYKKSGKSNIKEVMSKFEDVRARGRKRTMVG